MRDHGCLRLVLAGALSAASPGAFSAAQDNAETGEAPAARPAAERFAATAKYGSTGPGVDLTYGWSRDLHGRVSLTYEPHLDRTEDETIRASGSLLLDWHPGGGAFRLSGGLAYLRKEPGIPPASGEPIGSNQLASYFGIGWGNPLGGGSRWKFLVDLGAFWTGGLTYRTSDVGGEAASTSAARQSRSSGLRVSASWNAAVSTGVSFRF